MVAEPGGKSFSSLGMVAAFFSTFSRLHCPTSRFLQMSLELLVMEQFSRVTGFQPHGFLHRFLSQSSTTQILQLLLSDLDLLSDKCHRYVTQGLAPCTRKVYASV